MIVVCNKWRLIDKSDGKFKVNDMRKQLRSSVKIEDHYMKAQNNLAPVTGIFYEVDKEATRKRDEKINPKPEPTEKELLQARAEELGIEFDGRTGIEKLKELIAEKE